MSESGSAYNDDPRITQLLLFVTAVECLVLLVAGVGLLFLASLIGPEWPWELSPFNTLLLGAAYSSSLMATVTMVRVGRWAPARIVVPMIFFFTAIVLVVSLAYLDRFDAGSYSIWVWFALYIVIPVNALYHMWLYRNLKPYYPISLPTLWRSVLLIPIILLGLYGAGLLLAPETFSDFWLWPIDAFHGRVYSVLYLTPALGAILLWRHAASIELVALGLTRRSVGSLLSWGCRWSTTPPPRWLGTDRNLAVGRLVRQSSRRRLGTLVAIPIPRTSWTLRPEAPPNSRRLVMSADATEPKKTLAPGFLD